jgi:alpha-D-xyloside xylohydrolase
MFGPAFLVNPVTMPMYYAAGGVPLEGVSQTRPVYLPAGSDWYDFWTGERHAGGQTLTANADLETLPLYVRAGSIIPVGPAVQYSGELPDAPLELRIYGGQDGSFRLYEDEGDNYGYEAGAFAVIGLRWEEATRRLTLEERQGSYPGMAARREFQVTLLEGTGRQSSNRGQLPIIYEGREMTIQL